MADRHRRRPMVYTTLCSSPPSPSSHHHHLRIITTSALSPSSQHHHYLHHRTIIIISPNPLHIPLLNPKNFKNPKFGGCVGVEDEVGGGGYVAGRGGRSWWLCYWRRWSLCCWRRRSAVAALVEGEVGGGMATIRSSTVAALVEVLEGRGDAPVKFFAHLKEDEFEYLD